MILCCLNVKMTFHCLPQKPRNMMKKMLTSLPYPFVLYKFWNPYESFRFILECAKLTNAPTNGDNPLNESDTMQRSYLIRQLNLTIFLLVYKIIHLVIIFLFIDSDYWRFINDDQMVLLGIPKITNLHLIVMVTLTLITPCNKIWPSIYVSIK